MMQHYQIEKAAEHLFARRHPFGVQAQFLHSLPSSASTPRCLETGPEAVWGRFARDSPLEQRGFELPVLP